MAPTKALESRIGGTPPKAAPAVSIRSCVGLALLLVMVYASFEAGSRLLVSRMSRIEGRIQKEYDHLFEPVPAGKKSVFLVGNSLLDAGVRMEDVRAAFGDQIEVRRFVVENTAGVEWQYGLRRLLSEGIRPDIIVLMLASFDVYHTRFRGEYSVYRLVSYGDVIDFSQSLGLHPTAAANMVFSRYSDFFARRSEIRKFVLSRVMPDMPLLTRLMLPDPRPPMPDSELRAVLRQRLAFFRDIAAAYRVRIVLAVPPAIRFRGARALKEEGEHAGLPVLLPFGPGSFKQQDFVDGVHANERGAQKYTRLFVSGLRSVV